MTTDVKKPFGRPTLLTPELITKLSAFIADGNYAVTACNACGISDASLYNWLNKAKDDMEQGRESIYVDLFVAIKRAEAECEAELAKIARDSSLKHKNVIEIMTFLERRHPERWGRRERRDINVNETKTLKITTIEYGQPDYIDAPEFKELPEGG